MISRKIWFYESIDPSKKTFFSENKDSSNVLQKLLKAKEKQPTIIFIDEIDAIGTKRFDSEKAGDREVQRTMLELLSQLDGFEESNI